MSSRPSSNNVPVITNYQPRGRPLLASFGALLVLGGAVVWGLASSGTISLPSVADVQGAITGSTTPSVAPQGTAPVAFTAYRDPQKRFALYISSSWRAQSGTLSVNGTSLPATNITPNGANLPAWRIAFPSATLPSDSLSAINAVSATLTAEGAKNVTPVSGPQSVQVGGAVWTQLDFTYQSAKGLTVHAVAWDRSTTKGAVFVLAEDQTLTFTTTEKQDFTPMLTSLHVNG
jgi:hypothetical protein